MEPADTSRVFEVRHAEQFFQARLTNPILGLFKDIPELLGHLLSRLGPNGVRLTDFKFEPAGDSLGDMHLKLSVRARCVVRLYLDRIEVESAPLTASDDDVIVGVIDALAGYSPEATFESYLVRQGLHGHVAEVPAATFLSRFAASAPVAFGPLVGSGAVFYYGSGAETFAASVTIDLSRLFGEGIFFQVSSIYNASVVGIDAVFPLSEQKLHGLFNEVGLRL